MSVKYARGHREVWKVPRSRHTAHKDIWWGNLYTSFMVPAISEAVIHRVRLQTIQKPVQEQDVLAMHMNRRKN